jgi:multidrug efflux system membrane fusion protein
MQRPTAPPFAGAAFARLAFRGAIAFVIAASFPCGCSDGGNAQGPTVAAPAPVEVAVAEERSVPEEIRAIGNVEPCATVMMESRVDGQLLEVNFTEGQEVRKGDLLFQIDPRPFETALRKAEADLARDQAQAKNAKVEADRAERLFTENVSSKDQFDLARTSAEALEAAVHSEEAAVEDAKLQLSYATIRSPLDGLTGSLKVHRGNLVQADESVLVTIHQIAPIYVSFNVNPGQDGGGPASGRGRSAMRMLSGLQSSSICITFMVMASVPSYHREVPVDGHRSMRPRIDPKQPVRQLVSPSPRPLL